MRTSLRSLDWKTMVGGIALLATFLLAVPGVKAVRAEASSSAVSGDGPVCSQQDPEKHAMNSIELEQARARAMARIAAQAGSPKDAPVALNGRGYSYRPAER
jgi:hypothetical protein